MQVNGAYTPTYIPPVSLRGPLPPRPSAPRGGRPAHITGDGYYHLTYDLANGKHFN